MSSLLYTFRFDIGQYVFLSVAAYRTDGTIHPYEVVGRFVEQCYGGTKGFYTLRTPTLTLLQVADWEVISFDEAEATVRQNTLKKKKEERQFWKELSTENAKTEPERSTPPQVTPEDRKLQGARQHLYDIVEKRAEERTADAAAQTPPPFDPSGMTHKVNDLWHKIRDQQKRVVSDTFPDPDQADAQQPAADPLADQAAPTLRHTNNAEMELWKQGVDTLDGTLDRIQARMVHPDQDRFPQAQDQPAADFPDQ